MKAVVLSDNIPWNGLNGEWGLSIYITYRDKRILLDSGASGLFLENAEKLGIDLTQVDYAVLSHGHYDHSDGMETFFQTAANARFYVRPGCDACYIQREEQLAYGGVPEPVMERYSDRIVFAMGDVSPSEGVWLIPHKTPDLSAYGEANHMYILRDGKMEPDDYAHEQSLVFETEEGLIIFNSCSHGGADNIIREVGETFPGKKLRALIGGFHLFPRRKVYAVVGGFHMFSKGETGMNCPPDHVYQVAAALEELGVEEVYTGHCTGERGLAILQEELGGLVHPFHTGLVMEF